MLPPGVELFGFFSEQKKRDNFSRFTFFLKVFKVSWGHLKKLKNGAKLMTASRKKV